MPVSRDEMVKGYEFAKDQYVMFSPEELKALEEAGTQTADINEFVPISAIDPVYFDKAYYIAPDKGGAKPYALFAKALRESKRCAVGRWAARGKQYIVMIRPVDETASSCSSSCTPAKCGRSARSTSRRWTCATRSSSSPSSSSISRPARRSIRASTPTTSACASRRPCSRRSKARRSRWPKRPKPAARRSSI